MKHLMLLLPGILIYQLLICQPAKVYTCFTGTIHFRSDAPQELIKADSKELKGAIETTGKTFTFKIRVSSFEGFNSGLQKVHLDEVL